MENCVDCAFHIVLPDPDPYDWFCVDDVKVICNKTGKSITSGCRPYRIMKECYKPKWCPQERSNHETNT